MNHCIGSQQASPLPSGLSNIDLAEKFINFFGEKIDSITAGANAQDSEPEANSQNIGYGIHKLNKFASVLESNGVERMIKEFPNKV